MTSPNSTAKTIVITGASGGLGAAAARQLHRTRPQDNLVIVGRNPEKTRAVAEEVEGQYFLADFESLGQVRRLAQDLEGLEHIHALGNNAGGIFDGPSTTADGFERTWQVNVVAPFLLTSLLRDKLRADNANVVQTASLANFLMSKFDLSDPLRWSTSAPSAPTATPSWAISCSPVILMPTGFPRCPSTLACLPLTFPSLQPA